jgi:acyl-coenzyme A thioesterase PaaI-like protein
MEEEYGYPRTMGGFWTKCDAGQTLYGLLTDEGHRNRNQRIHGGVVLGLADHALGYTAVDAGQGRPQATVQLDVQFTGASRAREFLVARGCVTRMTRTLVFLRADIHAGDRLIATANGIWKILGA